MELDLGKPVTLKEFLSNKTCFFYGNNEDYAWLEHERHSYVKYPVFHQEKPSADEIRKVFAATGTKLLSYAELSHENEANAFWYVCKKIDEKDITGSFMRNLKTARKHLTIRRVLPADFYKDCFQPYSDTRQRNGIDDFTYEHFTRRFKEKNIDVANFVIGAYHNDLLISYVPLVVFPNFVEFEGPYTRTDSLKYCANELLIFTSLDHFLNKKQMAMVSYGFSSIQAESKSTRLHEFKIKVGFEAIPIRRKFIFNPKYRLLINPVTRGIFRLAGKALPKNKVLRKINGVFNLSAE